MKDKYIVLLAGIGIIALGIIVSASTGLLPADRVPFALGVLALFGALWFVYLRLRVRDE